MASITCRNCGQTHTSVATVRACHIGEVFPCTWLIQRGYDEDGEPIIVECGAATWADQRGYACERGHSHVYADHRAEEGWEYAEDADEAKRLMKAGVRPVDLTGRLTYA